MMNTNNIKITGQWGNEPIWRPKTPEEKLEDVGIKAKEVMTYLALLGNNQKIIMTKDLEIKNKLPTLNDLYNDKAIISKQNQLNIILNAEPKREWIKQHPFVKNLDYLPIERVEYLLTMIFAKWRVEYKGSKVLANSLVSEVRVWVKDPITGEWDYQDGVGAIPIQTAKGSGALEFDKMNTTAVQIGLPASESFAIKDACEKFGRIFGKDLNRKDNINYDRLYAMIGMNETMNNPSLTEEIRLEVENCETIEELKIVESKYSGLGKDFVELVVAQKQFIENENSI